MARKFLSLLCIVGLFTLAFAVVSYARGSGEGFGFAPNLPVGTLPPTSLSEQEKIAANNAIGSFQIGRAGITEASFDEVRKVQVPTGESMYVVPGQNGVCLVLGQTSACGAPGSDAPMLGLYVTDEATGRVVGGGITDISVRRVTLSLNGVVARLAVGRGVFVLSPEAGLRHAEDRTSPLKSSTS
jgi:hypothetical protein